VGSRDGNVYAFDAVTGSVLWTGAIGSKVDSCPTVVNGAVYVGAYDGNIYAFTL
jgi:outer membrane protein assembly factor BamB